MRMSFICCPFKTSYGLYASSLKAAIENKTGETVQWVGSNCGCGDPVEVSRQFQILKSECDYFEMPVCGDVHSKSPWKRQLKSLTRTVFLPLRAKQYANMSKNAEVVHFQQILNAYGSKVVFTWLQKPSKASRIVTVHELDGDQLRSPEQNKIYNQADGIIVHCEEMRQHLVRLGVQQEKIHVVYYGTNVPDALPDTSRKDIVFYGGHKLMTGKGIETLFKALSILHMEMGASTPLLKIHGHYGPIVPPEALQLAAQYGVEDQIAWLNQLPNEETVRLYQQSQLLLLPYTGGFAGYAASLAAACQLPIVCTRNAGLPDYLGKTGVWVEENNPEQLAEQVVGLLKDEPRRQQIGDQLLKRAKAVFRWDVIADQTLKIYEDSLRMKLGQEVKQRTTVAAPAGVTV